MKMEIVVTTLVVPTVTAATKVVTTIRFLRKRKISQLIFTQCLSGPGNGIGRKGDSTHLARTGSGDAIAVLPIPCRPFAHGNDQDNRGWVSAGKVDENHRPYPPIQQI
jgi:hypothetical protein